MKELSIKEKAKRYDDALERAKSFELPEYKNIMTSVFPELKEREDEKIRNFICNELACLRAADEKGSDRYEELTNAIAWLEKQCKDEPIDLIQQRVDALTQLEKQGEHNPAWSEKDIFKVQRICKYLDNAKKYYADITEVRECIDWLKSLKDRIQPQWKPSKEQMKQLNSAANIYPDSRIGYALRSLYQDLVTYM